MKPFIKHLLTSFLFTVGGRDTVTYASSILRHWSGSQARLRLLCHSIRFFNEWRHSLRPGATALSDSRPWLTFGAGRFLERILVPSMRVFEFGTGGSTLFFAGHGLDVVSVEHDETWVGLARAALARQGLHAHILWVPPTPIGTAAGTPHDLDAYISWTRPGLSFEKYAHQIDAFPVQHFDLVLIDGRSRPSCFKHALSRVKPHGFLVLDDA